MPRYRSAIVAASGCPGPARMVGTGGAVVVVVGVTVGGAAGVGASAVVVGVVAALARAAAAASAACCAFSARPRPRAGRAPRRGASPAAPPRPPPSRLRASRPPTGHRRAGVCARRASSRFAGARGHAAGTRRCAAGTVSAAARAACAYRLRAAVACSVSFLSAAATARAASSRSSMSVTLVAAEDDPERRVLVVVALVEGAQSLSDVRHRDATLPFGDAQAAAIDGELLLRHHELVARAVPCLDARLEALVELVHLREHCFRLRLLCVKAVVRRRRGEVARKQRGHQHHTQRGKCRPRDPHVARPWLRGTLVLPRELPSLHGPNCARRASVSTKKSHLTPIRGR